MWKVTLLLVLFVLSKYLSIGTSHTCTSSWWVTVIAIWVSLPVLKGNASECSWIHVQGSIWRSAEFYLYWPRYLMQKLNPAPSVSVSKGTKVDVLSFYDIFVISMKFCFRIKFKRPQHRFFGYCAKNYVQDQKHCSSQYCFLK